MQSQKLSVCIFKITYFQKYFKCTDTPLYFMLLISGKILILVSNILWLCDITLFFYISKDMNGNVRIHEVIFNN